MKSIKYLIILLNIQIFTYSDINVNIFVHGTRGISKLFFKYCPKENVIMHINEIPPNYITKYIAQGLEKSNSNHFEYKHFYVFGWSGKLSHKARLEAAQFLKDEIIILEKHLKNKNLNPKINLITHSHGGNVALNLAQHVQNNQAPFQINKLILLACPVQEHTNKLIHHNIFKNIYNIYSISDLTQILDPQGLHIEHRNKEVPFFSQRTFQCCDKLKQANIKINNSGLSHAGFLSSKFHVHLSSLLDTMDQLSSNEIASLHLTTLKQISTENL